MTKDQEKIKGAYDTLKKSVGDMFLSLQNTYPTIFSSWCIKSVKSIESFIATEMDVIENLRNMLHTKNTEYDQTRASIIEALDAHIDTVKLAFSSINKYYGGVLTEKPVLVCTKLKGIVFFEESKLIRDSCAERSAKLAAAMISHNVKTELNNITVELMKYAAEVYPYNTPDDMHGYELVQEHQNNNREHFPFSIPDTVANMIIQTKSPDAIRSKISGNAMFMLIDAFDSCFDRYYFIDRKHTPMSEDTFEKLDEAALFTRDTIGEIINSFYLNFDSFGTVFVNRVSDRYNNPICVDTYLFMDISTEEGLSFALELSEAYYSDKKLPNKLDHVLNTPYSILPIEDVLTQIQ